MARRELLFGLAVLAGVALAVTPSTPASACAGIDRYGGECEIATNGTINGGGVDLSAGFDAGSGGGGQAGSEAGGRAAGDPAGGGGQQSAATVPGPGTIVRDGFTINCVAGTPCDPNLIVSVSDLVSFRAAAPTHEMEPHGWSVVGLPTNFIATAAVHTRSGTLLGFPAEVRFTPVGFRWDFGAGQGLDSAGGGASWAALGLPEFSDTPTSHIFTESGSRSITLSVVYSAEYRFAGRDWRAVRGTLAVPATPLSVVVAQARTVLVNRECTAGTSGPGC